MNVLSVIVSETPGSAVPLDDIVATLGRFAAPVIALPRSRPGTAANLGDIFGNSPKR
jgi:hypothetical protein